MMVEINGLYWSNLHRALYFYRTKYTGGLHHYVTRKMIPIAMYYLKYRWYRA